jgi:hypothetical protein
MIRFTAQIHKFDKMGEKTGWTYIIVPAELASELHGENRRSFRVKGKLDQHKIASVALLPMKEGGFIMPLNAAMRKATGKSKGMKIDVQLEADTSEKPLSKELLECLKDEPAALQFFQSLTNSHKRYFSNWVDSAKTPGTQATRIAHCVNYLSMQKNFSTMLRSLNKNKQQEQ